MPPFKVSSRQLKNGITEEQQREEWLEDLDESLADRRPDITAIGAEVPTALVELMQHCWAEDPKARPDAVGVEQALSLIKIPSAVGDAAVDTSNPFAVGGAGEVDPATNPFFSASAAAADRLAAQLAEALAATKALEAKMQAEMEEAARIAGHEHVEKERLEAVLRQKDEAAAAERASIAQREAALAQEQAELAKEKRKLQEQARAAEERIQAQAAAVEAAAAETKALRDAPVPPPGWTVVYHAGFEPEISYNRASTNTKLWAYGEVVALEAKEDAARKAEARRAAEEASAKRAREEQVRAQEAEVLEAQEAAVRTQTAQAEAKQAAEEEAAAQRAREEQVRAKGRCAALPPIVHSTYCTPSHFTMGGGQGERALLCVEVSSMRAMITAIPNLATTLTKCPDPHAPHPCPPSPAIVCCSR